MKAPNAQVTENLQTACQIFAHLAGQYQVDKHQLHAMGLNWLASRIAKWKKGACCQLGIFIDRLLYFDTDPDYELGAVAGADSVDAILERAQGLVAAGLEQLVGFRKAAYEALADYTPDIYEHAIRELEKQAYKIERERSLIRKLGEPGYIGARLEDHV
jgi:bacterioferritin (cytochrome b1)